MVQKIGKDPKQSVTVLAAKYALMGVLIAAFLGLVGILIKSYVDYQISLIPIRATETAEVKVIETSQLEKTHLAQTQSIVSTSTLIPVTLTPTSTNTTTPSFTPTLISTFTPTPTSLSAYDFKSGCISATYWHILDTVSSKEFVTDTNNCWLLENWGITANKNVGLTEYDDSIPGSSLRAIYTVIPDKTDIHVQMTINKLISANTTNLPYIVIGITGTDGLYSPGQFLIFYGFYRGSVYGNASIFLSPGIYLNGEIKGEQEFGNPQDFYFSRDKRNILIKWGSKAFTVLLPPTQKKQAFWIGFGAPGGGSIDALISEFSYSQ